MYLNESTNQGPFDIIGDVHGCKDELVELLVALGYTKKDDDGFSWENNHGRTLIFVGDLTDRGPNSVGVCTIVKSLVEKGIAFNVLGNHDDKLRRWLKGNNVTVRAGLETTVIEFKVMEELNPGFCDSIYNFLTNTPHHLILDSGKLIIAHAGIKESLQANDSSYSRQFCLYGDIDGSLDEEGYPIRKNWEQDYVGSAMVVYGHTPTQDPHLVNNTINIDTGCVFGGQLTALRYPERDIIQVEAHNAYAPPKEDFKNLLDLHKFLV